MDKFRSECVGQIAKALAAATAEMRNPVKDREVEVVSKRTGGKYRFQYATLNAILAVLNPVLSKHGMSTTFPIAVRDGQTIVSLLVAHESGEWIESSLPLVEAGASNQERGSALSYTKRYLISMMFPIAADDDDDANIADGNDHSARDVKRSPPPAPPNKPQFAYVPSAVHPCSAIQNAIKAKANDGKVQLLPIMEKLTKDLGLEPREYREEHPKLVEYFSKIDAAVMAQEPK